MTVPDDSPGDRAGERQAHPSAAAVPVPRPAVVDVTDGRIAALRRAGACGGALDPAAVRSAGEEGAGPTVRLRGGREVGELRGQERAALTVVGLQPGPGRGGGGRRRIVGLAVLLIGSDGLALGIGWAAQRLAAAGTAPVGLGDGVALAVALPLWCGLVAVSRGYDVTGMAWPPRRAVLDAAARFAGVAALLLLLLRPAAARGLVTVVPVVVGASLVLRAGVRILYGGRLAVATRVLLVGGPAAVEGLAARLAARRPGPGVRIVGRCLTDARREVIAAEDAGAPDHAGGDDVLRRQLTATVRAAGADLVVLADTTAFPAPSLRRLAWALHASGVGLVVAAGPPGVSAHRLRVQAVDDHLSLLHVDPPVFTGVRRVLKGGFDRCGAIVLLVVLAPVLLVVAALVRASGPGPVIFRQERVGRHGERFVMLKFRSMCADAPARRARLEAENDHRGGVLFKMRADPRVTRVGRVLRRLSLDELPQLVNVVRGEMSLVGPRPALPAEVERYESDVLRRLLVKPGLTGLWQVSGRSDLDWAESVRLDLGYVENWSLAHDLDILARTVRAVLHGTGAR